MSSSTIFDAFRALLTAQSYSVDPDGVHIEDSAQSNFEARAELIFGEATMGSQSGGNLLNVNRVMIVKQGVVVENASAARDSAEKEKLTAEEVVIKAFMNPSNRPTGCRKIYFVGSDVEELSASNFIVTTEFQIEYTIDLCA